VDVHPVNVYAALGGHPGLRRAVDRFAERLVRDPSVSGYFASDDPDALRAQQLDLLAAAMGGPQRNSTAIGSRPPAQHAMTEAAFERVIGHLNAALVEVGADEGTIRDVIAAVSATHDLIVVA